MAPTESLLSRLRAAFTFDRALYEEVEKDPHAFWQALGIVVLAGAGRGVSPALEAGWTPIWAHASASVVIWLVCAGLIWYAADLLLGYAESFWELARVLGFAAVPLLGLWTQVLPIFGARPVVSLVFHGLAFVSLVVAVRAALSISTVQAVGVCLLSALVGMLLLFLLGVLFIGQPASLERVPVLVMRRAELLAS